MTEQEKTKTVLAMAALWLTHSDPSGAWRRLDEALKRVADGDTSEEALWEVDHAQRAHTDVLNGYRMRLTLDPEPYPWDALEASA